MPDPTFTQPERRSYLLPIVLALAALVAAGLVAMHFFPATTVNIAQVASTVVPTHTVFKADSIVVGQNESVDVLYIAEALRIDNQLRVPIYLDQFTLTFLNPQDQQLVVKALSKDESANAQLNFPQLTPLLTHPLLRETAIAPGKQAEGTVLFALAIPQSMYDARKSATVKVDLYHQYPVYQTIPKTSTPKP